MYVTGCLQLIVLGELHIQPLNHSVLFMKKTDIVFTSDKWRLALDFDLNTYYDVMSTISSDLLVVERRKQEFTPIHELKQISLLSQSLESKLQSFSQFLPRMDRRRSILNLRGNVLKFLFGTATVYNVHKLHEVFDKLNSGNSDLVYSLTDQLTYIKKLDTVTAANTNEILNLSNIIKENKIKSHVPEDNQRCIITQCNNICTK